MSDKDSEIARAEWDVVEAAVTFRQAESNAWILSETGTESAARAAKTDRARAYFHFSNAADHLIRLRKQLESSPDTNSE